MLPAYLSLFPLFNSILPPCQYLVPGPERNITEIRDIEKGVPVDFSYCEPATPENDFPSAPGCPKSDAGNPWVMYGNTPQCFLTGTKGPCEKGQTLVADKGQHFGYCMCDCLLERFVQKPADLQAKVKYCTSGKISQVFVPAFKSCFHLYSRGPCWLGEWLVKGEGMGTFGEGLRCERRKCKEGTFPSYEVDEATGEKRVDCAAPAAENSPSSLQGSKCGENEKQSQFNKELCVKTINKKTSGVLGR